MPRYIPFMLGKNDLVTIKTRIHTTDGRGGVTTVLSTKIESLQCSLQAVRREEAKFDLQGQDVVQPYLLMFDTITSGEEVLQGDIVVHSEGDFVVVTVIKTTGKGAHTEAILKKATSGVFVK